MKTSHFTDVTDALQLGTSDVLGGFNHLLQSFSVMAQTQHKKLTRIFALETKLHPYLFFHQVGNL